MTLEPDAFSTVVELATVTFLIGILIGFIGAGGAGVMVAILTTVFGLPVHTAIGTAIVAMLFVTVSGAISHFREGNVAYRLGLVVGLAGAAGAVLGADTSQVVSERALAIAAGLALWILALLVWVRTRMTISIAEVGDDLRETEPLRTPREWAAGMGLGATGAQPPRSSALGWRPTFNWVFSRCTVCRCAKLSAPPCGRWSSSVPQAESPWLGMGMCHRCTS